MKLETYRKAEDLMNCIKENKIKLSIKKQLLHDVEKWKSPIPKKDWLDDLIIITPTDSPSRITFSLKRRVLIQSVEDEIGELRDLIEKQQQEFTQL